MPADPGQTTKIPGHPAPVTVPIASYLGQRLRLLAICDDCWNVATLDPVALLRRNGQDFTTADLRAPLRCGRCRSRNTVLQVNGSPEGLMAGHQFNQITHCSPITDDDHFKGSLKSLTAD